MKCIALRQPAAAGLINHLHAFPERHAALDLGSRAVGSG